MAEKEKVNTKMDQAKLEHNRAKTDIDNLVKLLATALLESAQAVKRLETTMKDNNEKHRAAINAIVNLIERMPSVTHQQTTTTPEISYQIREIYEPHLSSNRIYL